MRTLSASTKSAGGSQNSGREKQVKNFAKTAKRVRIGPNKMAVQLCRIKNNNLKVITAEVVIYTNKLIRVIIKKPLIEES